MRPLSRGKTHDRPFGKVEVSTMDEDFIGDLLEQVVEHAALGCDEAQVVKLQTVFEGFTRHRVPSIGPREAFTGLAADHCTRTAALHLRDDGFAGLRAERLSFAQACATGARCTTGGFEHRSSGPDEPTTSRRCSTVVAPSAQRTPIGASAVLRVLSVAGDGPAAVRAERFRAPAASKKQKRNEEESCRAHVV